MTLTPSVSDQQFETILLRLESGESLRSVQLDFPVLAADIEALQDLQDFFAAQRSVAKPDPQGLKSVLRQVNLLNQASEDDELSWGSFFSRLSRSTRLALPALLVLGVSGYVWQSQIPASNLDSLPKMNFAGTNNSPIPAMVGSVELDQPNTSLLEGDSAMDMDALVQSLSNEFASEMADFEQTKESLEPLFSEQLFSFVPNSTL